MIRGRAGSRRGGDGRFTATIPGTRPGKRSVSVTAATFARVKARAESGGDAMTWVVDDAVLPVFEMSAAQQAALIERIRGSEPTIERRVAVPAAARRPARARPAPPPERPIPFWLLPTGPVRREQPRRRRGK